MSQPSEQQDKECVKEDGQILDVAEMDLACKRCKVNGKGKECRHPLKLVPLITWRRSSIEIHKEFINNFEYYTSSE
jgi:hypothetical protein